MSNLGHLDVVHNKASLSWDMRRRNSVLLRAKKLNLDYRFFPLLSMEAAPASFVSSRSTSMSLRLGFSVNCKVNASKPEKGKKKPFISQLDGGVLSWRQRDCWLRFEFLPNLNGASKKVRKQEGMTARSECNVIVKCTNSRRNISSLGIGSGCSRFESDMYLYLLLNFYVESWKRLLYIFVATSMQWSRPLFSFVFIFSIQLTVNVQCKGCRWLDSNRGPLELKATALPTEQQPDL